jgi:uncharacterized protein YjiS (DUF1127 family)
MFVTNLLSKIRTWRRYRRNVRELSSLSIRELDDIDLSCFETQAVAHKHCTA